jgi:hypothetical protein
MKKILLILVFGVMVLLTSCNWFKDPDKIDDFKLELNVISNDGYLINIIKNGNNSFIELRKFINYLNRDSIICGDTKIDSSMLEDKSMVYCGYRIIKKAIIDNRDLLELDFFIDKYNFEPIIGCVASQLTSYELTYQRFGENGFKKNLNYLNMCLFESSDEYKLNKIIYTLASKYIKNDKLYNLKKLLPQKSF